MANVIITGKYDFREVVNSANNGNYNLFAESQYELGSWGIVFNRKGTLVVDRDDPTDPKRKGEIAFPGSKKYNETMYDTAFRAVEKETGVVRFKPTCILMPVRENGPKNYARVTKESIDLITSSGSVDTVYFDSSKAYSFNPVGGVILNADGSTVEPGEVEGSGAKNPRFVPFDRLFIMEDAFTAACKIPLHFIEASFNQEKITLDKYGFKEVKPESIPWRVCTCQ